MSCRAEVEAVVAVLEALLERAALPVVEERVREELVRLREHLAAMNWAGVDAALVSLDEQVGLVYPGR